MHLLIMKMYKNVKGNKKEIYGKLSVSSLLLSTKINSSLFSSLVPWQSLHGRCPNSQAPGRKKGEGTEKGENGGTSVPGVECELSPGCEDVVVVHALYNFLLGKVNSCQWSFCLAGKRASVWTIDFT